MTKPNAQEKHEAEVVERMSRAKSIADKVFAASSNVYAVEEIAHYLEVADEEDFADDLERVITHTKAIYGTETPTPEQVFGVFDECFPEED